MKIVVPFALLLAVTALAAPAIDVASGIGPTEANGGEAPLPVERNSLERRVRLTVRVVGDGRDARVELPLPTSDDRQIILSEKLQGRGFEVQEEERDGNRLAILTHPKLEGARRITYEFTVKSFDAREEVAPVPVGARGEPTEEDWVWLRPTKQLQSSSPLIREKLITYAKPRLAEGENDAIRLSWDLAATGYRRKADGSRTVLKATRVGHASNLGLDRLFATFLRTSGVPSRPVIGVDVGSLKSRKHLARWVEVKSGGSWVPMSVPRDLYGELPRRFVKIVHGDRPFLVKEGVQSVSFRWRVDEVPRTSEVRP